MGFTMERHHHINTSDNNNLDLCMRRPTNFSIDHILSSKSSTVVSNKSGGMTLNKVPQNPWLSRGPRLFDPNLSKSQKSPKSTPTPVLSVLPPAFPPFSLAPQQLPPSATDYNQSAFNYLNMAMSPNLSSFQNYFFPKSEPTTVGYISDLSDQSSAVKPKIHEINNNNTNLVTFNGPPVNYLFNTSYRTTAIGDGHHIGGEDLVDKKPALLFAGDSLFDMTHKCGICEKIFGSSETLDAKNSTTNIGKRTATIAILRGALATEQRMEQNLKQLMDDLIERLDETSTKLNVRKVEKIQHTIARDKKAILILVNALELSRKNMTFEEYQRELKRIVHEVPDDGREETNEFVLDPTKNLKDQIPDLAEEIEHHVQQMKNDLKKISRIVLRQLKNEDRKAKEKVGRIEEMNTSFSMLEQDPAYNPQYPFFQPPLPYIEVGNGIDLFTHLRRQGDDSEEKSSSKEQKSSEKQEKDPFESEEFTDDADPAPGGLAGLIAALSGGEEGSDIGALIAALTQALTNIFGPGGLDVEGLLSSGTSLIAGLLAGEENFGKVLGGYVGTALDGFSGGGADNNGEFFGLFIGTLLSQLSADPEDDDLPAKPKIFIENFFKGFGAAQRKEGGDAEEGGGGHKDGGGSAAFFGFITHIVSSIVGGITSFIANASLGSSAGSSAGSAEFSAGSSGSSSGDHHPTHKP